ncbi:ThiF family adenylyltransferase [Zunongwangia atlantica]|uniref:Uncharacterized protein n=1 Tax=Zunongwangia atlantica 22II14-10F7 TaxID=1185767 RepID=A0A1Y1T3U9_9FLAO|nr:ThiF family adenylyltransferase [Zunongwangia atlantica]ORL45264.1 hypothetical protein IIF7_12452 [Zunongwangia atlantica 22II14-10F7]
MLGAQISLNSDINQLRNSGYEVEIRGNFLLIHSVPYLNSKKELELGTLVSNVSTTKVRNHVCYFIGNPPCNIDGSIMTQLINNSNIQNLGNGIVINHMFSHKPKPMYPTYYAKMTTYINILSATAQHYFPKASAKTGKVIESNESNSVFYYSDTNSSRAEIDAINSKISGLNIGIIGLGGTGSYILDKVAKTMVKEISLFDGDRFQQHNAFRIPGAVSKEKIDKNSFKVDYLAEMYSQLHKNIIPYPKYIDETNVGMLKNLDFVFIAIDNGEAKKLIFNKLEQLETPFIDCGISIRRKGDELRGSTRTTISYENQRSHVWEGRVSFSSPDEDEYSSNIQICELNSLNADFAIIKWKKYYGYYSDLSFELDSSFSIDVNKIVNNEIKD